MEVSDFIVFLSVDVTQHSMIIVKRRFTASRARRLSEDVLAPKVSSMVMNYTSSLNFCSMDEKYIKQVQLLIMLSAY